MGNDRRRERVTGVILALLVVLSLVLSFGLWWSAAGPLTGEELWRQEPPSPPPTPEWYLVVKPTRLLVHLEGDRRAMFLPASAGYRDLWEAGCTSGVGLAGLGPPARDPLRESEARALEEGAFLDARFPAPLPGQVVARAYGLRGDLPELVEGLVVAPAQWPYVAVRYGGRLYPLEGAAGRDYRMLDQLLSGLGTPEAVAGAGGVPAVSPTLPEGWEAAPDLWVPKMAAVPRLTTGFVPPPGYGQTLVGQFFADPGVVRRIEERDGATIFTDGRSGLRVYPSGALEYNTPPPTGTRGSIEPDAALSVALSFLAGHGGIPPGMVLWGYRSARLEEERSWALGMGLLANGLVAVAPGGAVSLAVGEQGLYEYRAAAWTPWRESSGSQRIMSAQEAMARLAARHRGGARVLDVYPAYTAHPAVAGELRPAWIVRTENDQWAVDAVTGQVQSFGGRW
ncbi:MAG: hypothetical protein QME70_06290 [Bacillota bacterium]|nr:hypothetical protein [Bacillota bacterium]